MNGQNQYNVFLKQIIPNSTKAKKYELVAERSTIIGREHTCQIILDSREYSQVSRRHVEIRPLVAPAVDGSPQWEVCDLQSSNGTFVNGQRLSGCQILKSGDLVALGQQGAEFVYESEPLIPPTVVHPASFASKPDNTVISPVNTTAGSVRRTQASRDDFLDDASSWSQIMPIISTRQDLRQKAFLVPAIVTIVLVVALLTTIGKPVLFNFCFATYLAIASFYFVYRLCGKHKPWWLFVAAALTTIFILATPLSLPFFIVFRHILPGDISGNAGFIPTLIAMFFGAGLMEELIKAVPVFIALWIGQKKPSPLREQIGVWEPLDGILIGAASAVGFTLLETLGQYVPNIIASVTSSSGQGAGELVGLQLLIPRIIGSAAGHLAYSGYFGYFIGLAMMKKRSQRIKIIAIGYLTSSLLHAFWNAAGQISIAVNIIAGILAYIFLVAAILKARELSPTRENNFATFLKAKTGSRR
jgi:RsiW-degrading membrane proteinase PrsW (M82 family)